MFPIAVKLGPITVTSFGLCLTIGFILALFFAYRSIKNVAVVDVESLFDHIFFIALFSFLGARIAYIFFHFEEFGFDVFRYLLIREKPGLSFIGAVIGGGIIFLIQKKTSNIAWVKIIDGLTKSLIVVLIFGHVGSFLDGFSFGKETSLPWGVSILGESSLRHPLPLYYLTFLLLFLMFSEKINFLAKKNKWPEGTIFIIFVALYSLFSLIMSHFRSSTVQIASYSLDFLFNLFLFCLATIVLYARCRNIKHDVHWFLAILTKTMLNIKRGRK